MTFWLIAGPIGILILMPFLYAMLRDTSARSDEDVPTGRRRRLQWSFAAFLVAVVATGWYGVYRAMDEGSGRALALDPVSGPAGMAHPGNSSLPDVDTMVRRLAARLEATPDNAEGWRMLGWSYLALGRESESLEAYRRAVALDGDNARIRSEYGEALVKSSGGQVRAEARAAFKAALKSDPENARSRYYLALAKRQAGDVKGAHEDWRALLSVLPSGSQWHEEVSRDLAATAKANGVEPPTVVAAPKRPAPRGEALAFGRGPTAAEVEAASRMTPADRAEMIRSMVEGLHDRLRENPDDPDGWRRLGRSYHVLGDNAQSARAYSEYAKRRPDDAAAAKLHARAAVLSLPPGAPYPQPAVEALRRLLELDDSDVFAILHLGRAAERSNDRAGAIGYFTRLLKLAPASSKDHAEARGTLARLTDQR